VLNSATRSVPTVWPLSDISVVYCTGYLTVDSIKEPSLVLVSYPPDTVALWCYMWFSLLQDTFQLPQRIVTTTMLPSTNPNHRRGY